MIESVRSTAIGTPCRCCFGVLGEPNNSLFYHRFRRTPQFGVIRDPRNRPAALAGARRGLRGDANPRNGNEFSPRIEEREPLALPRGHAAFLEQRLKCPPGPTTVGPQPFAPGPEPRLYRSPAERPGRHAAPNRRFERQRAAEFGQMPLRPPRPASPERAWWGRLLCNDPDGVPMAPDLRAVERDADRRVRARAGDLPQDLVEAARIRRGKAGLRDRPAEQVSRARPGEPGERRRAQATAADRFARVERGQRARELV